MRGIFGIERCEPISTRVRDELFLKAQQMVFQSGIRCVQEWTNDGDEIQVAAVWRKVLLQVFPSQRTGLRLRLQQVCDESNAFDLCCGVTRISEQANESLR